MGFKYFNRRLRLAAAVLLTIVALGFFALEYSGARHAANREVRSELPVAGRVVTSPVASAPSSRISAQLPAALATLAATHRTVADPGRPAPRGSTEAQSAEPEGEVCGLGNAPPGSAEAASLSKAAELRDAEAAARLFALMAQSPDAATRAAAQLGSDQRASLAMAAQQTRDPIVYALAQQACTRPGTQPDACALLSPHRMASLDPLNVVPWLWVAEEASRVGNDQSVVEAVHRASLAKESRQREYAFTSLALSAIPADWPTSDAVFASAYVLQIHAALRLPSYLPMVKYCSAEHARDVNVRQTCDRLAQVLVERGDTLVDHGIGRRVGERAGWPTEKVELLDAHHAAYTRLALDGDTLASGSGHGSCRQLVRNVQLALAHARDGELPYVKARLAESGTTDADTLLQYRKGQAASSPR